MNKLSLNMIVKDEEKFLAGCLDSVKDLVDEIIIADTGSRDNTVEIAKKYGAKVFFYEWKNDFSDARNFVLQKSESEWILYLDADERIEKVFHPQIKKIIERIDVDAVQLKLRSIINTDTHQQIQIVPYPRLFRKLDGIKFEGRIHEQITPALVKAGAKFEESNVIINHLGYSQDDNIIEKKKRRNLESLIKIVQEEPENAYAHFQLGQNLILINEHEKGAGYLKSALDLGSLTRPVAASAMASLAQYYNKIGDLVQAESLCKKSLKIAPNQLFAKLLLGEVYSNAEHYSDALNYYNQTLEYIQIPEHLRKSESAVDVSYNISFVYYKIGIVQLKQRNLELAEQNFLKSYKNDDSFNPSLIELGNISFQLGKFDSATGYLRKVKFRELKDINLLMNIAGLFDEMKEFNDCAKVLEHVIDIDPINPKALFFIGCIFLNSNDLEKAGKYLLKSHELAPEVIETIQNLAVVHIKQNDYRGALSEFLKLEKLLPDDNNVKRKIAALKKKIEVETAQ